MQQSDVWVDNGTHLLHLGPRTFPCDRDVEAVHSWKGQALLLSSDTDCLSLWDSEGLVRTARVGIYPQDMTIQGNTAYVCGGADSKLHLLALPELHKEAEFSLPGMPERICIHNNHACILTLMPDPEAHCRLLQVNTHTGCFHEISSYKGVPGAIATDDNGLWIGVSALVLHLPYDSDTPDLFIEGIGLARKITITADGITIADALNDKAYHFCIRKERSPCDERPCV